MNKEVALNKTEFEAFERDLAKVSMLGQWQYDAMLESVIGGPKSQVQPTLWDWNIVREKLDRACEVMEESYTARRNLCFVNPGSDKGGTTNTLVAGMQVVKPGEVAWAHRHSISALRFVMDGDPNLFTVVEGERLNMEPNDLILTPAWCWHDHHNESDKFGRWLDVLDVSLVASLGQVAYEPLGQTTQPLRDHRHEYVSERVGVVRPLWERPGTSLMPYRYPWTHVRQQLELFCEGGRGSKFDDVILEYVDPRTGGAALPTMRCCVQRLRPRFKGAPHRRTSSTIYYVVQGSGTTVCGGKTIEWKERDVFAIPPWNWCEHKTSEGATLFSVSDAPLLEVAHLYREEPASSVHGAEWPESPLWERQVRK